MKSEKEKLQELLDSKYSEGLKHGMAIENNQRRKSGKT